MSIYKLHKRIAMCKFYGASNLTCLSWINDHKSGRRLPARVKAKLCKERVCSFGRPYLTGYTGPNKYLRKAYNKVITGGE